MLVSGSVSIAFGLGKIMNWVSYVASGDEQSSVAANESGGRKPYRPAAHRWRHRTRRLSWPRSGDLASSIGSEPSPNRVQAELHQYCGSYGCHRTEAVDGIRFQLHQTHGIDHIPHGFDRRMFGIPQLIDARVPIVNFEESFFDRFGQVGRCYAVTKIG